MASSSARCSAVRFSFMVGFIRLLPRLGNVISRDRTDDKRVGQVQYLENNRDEATSIRAAKCDGTARRVADVESRVLAKQHAVNLFGREAVFRDVPVLPSTSS